ncbi:hypothetical protein [Burkholderia multivorans]|uniref:hypothetical protein n=1 Tax=Burkholderia multivorans TaxID=87883 RepID=UPI002019938C|nr:hypothetical protein [Burkholderia multivorans]MCO1380736.1 hypothetical protein [Burkholderia multivorans]MCO1400850.1 hypothetical protein [Burkholderia multivorans]UQO77411.1 hypothetical protein L0Z12_16685 [Burkholderia multivorans]
MTGLQTPTNAANKVAELRVLANLTAEAALSAAPGRQVTVLEAAEQLGRFADGLERRAKNALSEPAVLELPSNATVEEVQRARRRQAARRGAEVYLPSWSTMARALPNAFLRSALFSAGRTVQADNAAVLSGDPSLLVAGKEIATFRTMSLIFSGYELCQFDRIVYATCLDYYREVPLCPEEGIPMAHFRAGGRHPAFCWGRYVGPFWARQLSDSYVRPGRHARHHAHRTHL